MATAQKRLWTASVDQCAYITRRDAPGLGISKHALDMLSARGQIVRVAHGVYRFPQFPDSEFDPYMLAVLWTGTAAAALSHDTALAAHDVCEINPARIHVTVPVKRRIRRAGGEPYVVHHQDLFPGQVGWWQQIPTVTLATAMAQCVRWNPRLPPAASTDDRAGPGESECHAVRCPRTQPGGS